MKSRDFVQMVKRYSVDDVVEETIKELQTPRRPPQTQSSGVIGRSISQWENKRFAISKGRSEWFNGLPEKEKGVFQDILQDCVQNAVTTLFTMIDGVGGPYEGVFEIVAIDSDEQRYVINPQNTDMLHDLFTEVCQGG
jgi:hypothetical protein